MKGSFIAHNAPMKISVVVTTYNWPAALETVLKSLLEQKTFHAFEIIVADDGSKEETAVLINSLKEQSSIPLLHIWQPDEGFRAAAIRNKAILAANGDYIIFLDGDCVPREDFVEKHFTLAEPRAFVVGNRVLLTKEFTEKVLTQGLPIYQWSLVDWFWAWLAGHCNRLLPLIALPLTGWRTYFKTKVRWRGAKGCNLAVWKEDLLSVNGWEEKFVGWGYEDSDLVIRLLHSGIKRKSGRFYVPVIHLWHPENDRTRERDNWLLLKEKQAGSQYYAEKGLNQSE